MRELDNEFFEEYKRLDKLCREMFSSEKGVSEYIRQMELAAAQGRRSVPAWDRYYSRLKRWRWLRNQLAHDASAACEEEDLVQLREFYDSIFAAEDPFAILHKNERRQEPAKQPVTIEAAPYENEYSKRVRKGLIRFLFAAAIAVCVLLIAVMIISIIVL